MCSGFHSLMVCTWWSFLECPGRTAPPHLFSDFSRCWRFLKWNHHLKIQWPSFGFPMRFPNGSKFIFQVLACVNISFPSWLSGLKACHRFRLEPLSLPISLRGQYEIHRWMPVGLKQTIPSCLLVEMPLGSSATLYLRCHHIVQALAFLSQFTARAS